MLGRLLMMHGLTCERSLVLGTVVVLAFGSLAVGQVAPAFPPVLNTEQNPLRNVGAGALAGRSPGNMVSAGVARTLAAADFGRSIIEIDEPLAGPDPKATFLVDAIEIVFDQLNRAILLFENALRLRAGLPPRVPIDFNVPSTDDGSQVDGTVDAGAIADLLNP